MRSIQFLHNKVSPVMIRKYASERAHVGNECKYQMMIIGSSVTVVQVVILVRISESKVSER